MPARSMSNSPSWRSAQPRRMSISDRPGLLLKERRAHTIRSPRFEQSVCKLLVSQADRKDSISPAGSMTDPEIGRETSVMTKQTMIATAISIFAASSFVAASANAQVKCAGTNACKGQSSCKGGASACKGQNACKGQGFSDVKDVVGCQNQGGKPVTQ